MGFYSSADDLAKAIRKFKEGLAEGLPEGGKKELQKFRTYYDQLPKPEREAFRMNYPAEYRFWIKRAPRKPFHGEQLEMDLTEGRKLRDKGMAQVTTPEFSEAVRGHIGSGDYLGRHMSAEQIRFACQHQGINPHHHNAWGGVTYALLKAGVLRDTEQATHMTDPRSHARKTTVYEVLL